MVPDRSTALSLAVGEIIEWIGFAIACWSLPAAAFAVYTFANLAPRALKVCMVGTSAPLMSNTDSVILSVPSSAPRMVPPKVRKLPAGQEGAHSFCIIKRCAASRTIQSVVNLHFGTECMFICGIKHLFETQAIISNTYRINTMRNSLWQLQAR